VCVCACVRAADDGETPADWLGRTSKAPSRCVTACPSQSISAYNSQALPEDEEEGLPAPALSGPIPEDRPASFQEPAVLT
jgi:hypothetical protein